MTAASNHRPTWDPTQRDAINQAVTFANVFTQAALDAAHIGISPDVIRVDHISDQLTVTIQIRRGRTADADRLADLYGLTPDTGRAENYTRHGHTIIAADVVAVRVYCARGLQAVL
jgi:hypothetical protein